MLDTLAPEVGLPMGPVLANRGLLAPVVLSVMEGKSKTNATIRTTTAVTMLEGSVQANVLPQRARAVVNFRIAPGDTLDTVVEHVRSVVGPDLEVRLLEGGIGSNPSPVSPTSGVGWSAVQTATRQTYPSAVVSPYLTIGATDARHYTGLAENVYRFSPYHVVSSDLDRIHGVDERISVQNLGRSVAFFERFIRAANGGE
ncbi:MAG: M20/M25/M40 family metallo-hydrolase [Proteobacteria bacterium]|nr:M20/M25/M40 family metallo-hydrolase [Pseudomonadota bacterium]